MVALCDITPPPPLDEDEVAVVDDVIFSSSAAAADVFRPLSFPVRREVIRARR